MFLLPWLVGFFCLTLGPALVSLYLSFTSFDLVRSPRWIGAANYARIATNDAKFLDSLAVTFTYVAVAVPLKICFALGVAIALNKGIRGLPIYRAIFYLPSLLGASVAIAVLWRIIFAGDGLFNHLLAMLGLHLYADNEAHDGYLRDRRVFSPEIDIEDTMHALIEYENGISANYKLTAYNPCEGYRVTFDGTRGRIEHKNVERSHVQTDGSLVRPPLP